MKGPRATPWPWRHAPSPNAKFVNWGWTWWSAIMYPNRELSVHENNMPYMCMASCQRATLITVSFRAIIIITIPVKSTDFGGSLPIFLPSSRQPTDLPQSTDFYRFFRGSTEFLFFLPIPLNVLLFFLLFHVNYALTNVIFMYLWWKVLHHIINIIYSTLQGVGIFCI